MNNEFNCYSSEDELADALEPEDPDHDRKCDICGSKLCEGECQEEPKAEHNSTQLPEL